jgi:hypothetical protein
MTSSFIRLQAFILVCHKPRCCYILQPHPIAGLILDNEKQCHVQDGAASVV